MLSEGAAGAAVPAAVVSPAGAGRASSPVFAGLCWQRQGADPA